MNFHLSLDPIQKLHWQTIKSILGTLSLLPASYLFHNLWFYSNDSDQLVIRFFALTLFDSWIMVAFSIAIVHTISNPQSYEDLAEPLTAQHQTIIHIYRQIPILFFAGFILFIQSQFC